MKYIIPTIHQIWGTQEIEANCLTEAIQKAKQSLPTNGEYVEDSQQIDYDSLDSFNIEIQFEQCSTPEPCLRDIIYKYYEPFFPPEQCAELTEQYIEKMKEHMTVFCC